MFSSQVDYFRIAVIGQRRATFYLDRLRRLMANVMGEFSEGQFEGAKSL